MKFYLSSYKLGNKIADLEKLIKNVNKNTAYIPNALDFSNDLKRREESEKSDISELEKVGLRVQKLDLRDYFGRQSELKKILDDVGVIWVRGGNVFVLRQAMYLSGFDNLMKNLIKENKIYGGYSAGACVLSPNLRGFDLVDDSKIFPYSEQKNIIWQGLGLISYSFIPHYNSDHDESGDVNTLIKYMVDNKILFKAFRDGEVCIF